MNPRPIVPFREVNRRGYPGFVSNMQRHHLLPQQLLGSKALNRMMSAVDPSGAIMLDFRRNGLLLPCAEAEAWRTALPLHRGPHRRYNHAVMERLGRIEAGWQRARKTSGDAAVVQAGFRLTLLQSALRRSLIAPKAAQNARLNRGDTMLRYRDFSTLDAMAELMLCAR